MAAFLDNCRFIPTAGGTADFTYLSAAGGCQSPAAAGAQNGVKYKLRAESTDLTQWEIFEGAYNSTTGTFARTTVLYNSSGTGIASGQSGAGSKINFSTVPQVAVVGLAEDLISIEVANNFTAAQQAQARANIFKGPTTQVFTSGSGTYTTPTGCLWIEVEIVGGGASGFGSGSGGGQNSGGNSTFNTFTANGGVGRAGGSASGGILNIPGQNGYPTIGGTAASPPGGDGGGSAFYGGGGRGLNGGSAGETGVPNSGGGGAGGGGSSVVNTGSGGGAGGSLYGIVNNPNATYSYAVGAGGAAGAAGASGFAGGAGATGRILVIEHYI